MMVPARPNEVTVPSLEKVDANDTGWNASRGPKYSAHRSEIRNCA